jgi:hypothetical protein
MTDNKPTYSDTELLKAYNKLQQEHVATTNNLQHLRQLCNEKNVTIARLQAELDAANLAMTRAAQVNGVGLKSADIRAFGEWMFCAGKEWALSGCSVPVRSGRKPQTLAIPSRRKPGSNMPSKHGTKNKSNNILTSQVGHSVI